MIRRESPSTGRLDSPFLEFTELVGGTRNDRFTPRCSWITISLLGVTVMNEPFWLIRPDRVQSSYLLLAILTGIMLALGAIYRIGLVGWLLRVLGLAVRGGIRRGFLAWEKLFGWAAWPQFLAVLSGFFVVGGVVGGWLPGLRAACGLATIFLGAIACCAYMFIELERDEVERGHKAVHNPLKGQVLARYLARYGQQVRVPLLLSAIGAIVAGFALFNQGLFESVGRGWYEVPNPRHHPIYADFLAYSLTNLLNIIDVLDLAKSHHLLGAANVRQARWPASVMLVSFKMLFTLVLLQQLFSSLRQRKVLAETIADFWSPHEPIHARARDALPQYGVMAIGPLMMSLRELPSLTKEQRDQLPLILAAIGPSTVPALLRHLNDPREHMRAIAATALGLLHDLETAPMLAELARDPSDVVRQCAVEALGTLCAASSRTLHGERGRGRRSRPRRFGSWFRRKKGGVPAPLVEPVALAVATLESALGDDAPAVRSQAAIALGRIGQPASEAAPALIHLLQDVDDTVRCHAAEGLGQVEGDIDATVAALVVLLRDASAPVKAAAARALGALKEAAEPAVPTLVPLLQDRDELVRAAAAEAIAQVGPLNGAAIGTLVDGLGSPDNVVRARTAEALGTIGTAASEAAPALIEAMEDGNDRVRAQAVKAIGQIGEVAAAAAIPGLVRALRDQDNWVSALAAEALGQMGEAADGTIIALVRSLEHLNPRVRGNAAEALGKMGAAAARARPALESAAQDEDGVVRSQAIRALGSIGLSEDTSARVVLAGLSDADPLVRVAAVESIGRWDEPSASARFELEPLLEDANEQVRAEATRVFPGLAGTTPAVIDGLCRRLLDDDSVWVQLHAALALGRLGHAALAAGGPLLRAAQTAEVSVREQAMRAIAMIQPPETAEAFLAGLKDACGDIRVVASAGWMNAADIPEAAIPALLDALRDSEIRVRANAAHALGRLDVLPASAVSMLVECAADPDDRLRINVTLALKRAPAGTADEFMVQMLADPNSRTRLIAASSLLSSKSDHARASVVVVEALRDPAPRVRKAALELVESLGPCGESFLESLIERDELERDADLRDIVKHLIESLESQADLQGQQPILS